MGVLATGVGMGVVCAMVVFNARGWLDRQADREWELRGRRPTLIVRSEGMVRARFRIIASVGLALGVLVVGSEFVALLAGHVG